MLEEAFYRYNPWWEEQYLFEGLIERELVEVKYKDEIKEKQKVLFDNFKAKKKILIQSIYDLKKLE